jgi:hypothetical protein
MKRPIHVMPINDQLEGKPVEHLYEDCWCRPRLVMMDEEGNFLKTYVYVHNSADRREYNEIALDIIKKLDK